MVECGEGEDYAPSRAAPRRPHPSATSGEVRKVTDPYAHSNLILSRLSVALVDNLVSTLKRNDFTPHKEELMRRIVLSSEASGVAWGRLT